jgi:hypothetical protein
MKGENSYAYRIGLHSQQAESSDWDTDMSPISAVYVPDQLD